MTRRTADIVVALALSSGMLAGCEDLDRFDTDGDEAYCGSIVSAQFIRTSTTDGGFERNLRLRLELDADALTTAPGTLSSDDGETGPCSPLRTFEAARLRVTPEIYHDPLSMMSFSDRHDYNLFAWVDSTCRGPMLSVVSLLKNDDVEVRLMKPADGTEASRPAFALFELRRRSEGCGF